MQSRPAACFPRLPRDAARTATRTRPIQAAARAIVISVRPPRTDDFNHGRQDVAVCWKRDATLARVYQSALSSVVIVDSRVKVAAGGQDSGKAEKVLWIVCIP